MYYTRVRGPRPLMARVRCLRIGDNMPSFQSHLSMFVLDVLRHDDLENIASIINMLNDKEDIGWRKYWPHDFLQEEVLPAIAQEIQQGNIEPCKRQSIDGPVVAVTKEAFFASTGATEWWYHLTSKGYSRWQHWLPPGEDGT
jgi:hypothetical protein